MQLRRLVPCVLLLAVGQAADRKPFDLLAKDAEAPRPETRRAAVQGLAQIGDRRAWDLVVRMLDDRDPMVADEAEVALGSAADPKLVADLFGAAGLGNRDAWIRL